MPIRSVYRTAERQRWEPSDHRLRWCAGAIMLVALFILGRLFTLMILDHGQYVALAAGTQELYATLFPDRGAIFMQDSRTGERYPLALNRDAFTVYADTTKITTDEAAESVARGLADVFAYDDDKKLAVYLKLNARQDPYVPLEKKVSEEIMERLKGAGLPGIGFARLSERYYPEGTSAAHVVGFVGRDADGNAAGRYGIEGYWQTLLAGTGGWLSGRKSPGGGLIPLAGSSLLAAEDGADIHLTLDRTLQFKACERLRQAVDEYHAISGALVIMDPESGAIRAMCSLPDFDPNQYNKVESVEVYNNTTIFTPYEPGSVFKPFGMAAAMNEGLVTPAAVFHDTGSRPGLCTKPIQNALFKSYGDTTMTGVLVHSINTGMVFIAEKLGKEKFRDYVERFGFGVKEGIELDKEVSGTIESLSKNKGNSLDCYTATASFGQGLTVTPLQLAAAYSALGNGGLLMRPYIVEEVRHSDGRIEKFAPREIRRVIETKTASTLSAMLVKVVDEGEGRLSQVPQYYLAGKTGTAQIAGPGGYTDTFNHTFVGFGPVDQPRFVMVVKLEKPEREYASYTTAPVFRDIARFVLQYYQVPPER